MTESVNVGREDRYTIGLIDEDRIKHIKAMNTERDTYNQIEYARETLTVLSTIIFDPLDICQFWSCCYNMLDANMLHTGMELSAPAKTPFRCYLLAFIESTNFLMVNV